MLLAAAFWGFDNISQKLVLDHVDPFSAVCLRCSIAAVVMLPLVAVERKQKTAPGFLTSILWVSASFAAAICLQQYAYLQATVTIAGFLVNVCTVLTPLVAWLLFRERPGGVALIAAMMTLAGVFLMSGSSGIFAFNAGDMACLASALFYALWIVALGRHTQTHGSPFTSAFFQFAMTSVVALPLLVLEKPAAGDLVAAGPNLLVLGLFTTAAAFGLQTYAQKYTTASKAAVIVSAESIFGAVGAFAVLGERPPLLVAAGAAVILTAIMLVSLSTEESRDKVNTYP